MEVAYRIIFPRPGYGGSTVCIAGNTGSGSVLPQDSSGKTDFACKISADAVLMARDRKTTDVRIGVGAGPWELAAKLGPNGGKCKRTDLPTAEFTTVKKPDGELVVESILGFDWDKVGYRLIVVEKDGAEHVMRVSAVAKGHYAREEAEQVGLVRSVEGHPGQLANGDQGNAFGVSPLSDSWSLKTFHFWPGEKTQVQTVLDADGKQNDAEKKAAERDEKSGGFQQIREEREAGDRRPRGGLFREGNALP